MTRSFSPISGVALAAALFFASAPKAEATLITAVECSVNAFFCPLVNIIASGTQGVVNGLIPGQFDIVNYNFNNADLSFVGVITTTNVGGILLTLNGQGIATANAGANGGAEFWLNVDITQSYLVNPAIVGGIGAITEYNNGTCDANAVADNSSISARLVANGTALPVMGGAGNCAATGGVFAYNGFAVGIIPNVLVLDGIAQFDFKPDAFNAQMIDLPYGETDSVPEPGTWAMMSAGAAALIFMRRKFNRG